MADQQWSRLYYDDWVTCEGLDLMRGNKVENVYTVSLKHWARTGGQAVHIQLDGTGDLNAAYVQEIPPGKALEPQRHVYEELVYVLYGRGSTSVWYPGAAKNSFEWQAGSLFSIPLNACYQHFNGSGQEPARYVAVTTAPIMMNLMRNDDFIFENDTVFPERYNGEHDYFAGELQTETYSGWGFPYSVAVSNFFSDINAIPPEILNHGHRGTGTSGLSFILANGVLGSHILEVPGGVFTKPHRHGPGAHVLWLKGEGYSMLWPDGGELLREDWGPGTMLVPPSWWWHQHAVVSKEPAQHLALRLGNTHHRLNRLSSGTLKNAKEGGSQLDFEDLPDGLGEQLKRTFAEECAKRGTLVQWETVEGL
ncbi:MAG TPA: ethanolamine ammonia lyase-activating protein [Chloroflexota bacterium]|jgi:uncharacterized RmlC-like cupin family protein|nr:ethanolamine ammonia lyase-activating protein [Chloroflexota bacterium]